MIPPTTFYRTEDVPAFFKILEEEEGFEAKIFFPPADVGGGYDVKVEDDCELVPFL